MASLQHYLSSSITTPTVPIPSRLLRSTPGPRRFTLLASVIDRHSLPLEERDQKKEAVSRRQLIAGLHMAAAAAAAASFSPQLQGAALAEDEPLLSEWGRVYIPIDPGDALLDIAFVSDGPNLGFLLGTRQTTWLSGDLNLLTVDWTNTNKKKERPRFFDSEAKKSCWDKAKPVPGRDPDRWRIDAIGNIVCKRLHTCNGCLCYEFDHVRPFSKGGESIAENCQVLQTRVNRLKSDKGGLDEQVLKGYSCNIRFNDEELDAIEMAVYGSINRLGKQCIIESISPNLVKRLAKKHIATCI